MKKEMIIKLIKDTPDDKIIVFFEKLQTGQKNQRTIFAERDKLYNILENYFDENSYGHFNDGIYTTIEDVGYTEISLNENDEQGAGN
jgi:hypothetical protein